MCPKFFYDLIGKYYLILTNMIKTRPIPARSCGAGVRDCRVKELDIFGVLVSFTL